MPLVTGLGDRCWPEAEPRAKTPSELKTTTWPASLLIIAIMLLSNTP